MRTRQKNTIQYIHRLNLPWRHFVMAQVIVVFILTLFFFVLAALEKPLSLDKRSWGGWDEHPDTERCYKQERKATLFALWLGLVGGDHWYARHWALAVFKMCTFGGFGIWAVVDINLWIIGGIYGTKGCPGGKEWRY